MLVLAAKGAQDDSAGETTPTATTLTSPVAVTHPSVRLELRYPGVYRVSGRELADGGADLATIRPAHIALRNRDTLIPVHVVTAEADHFGPADYIQFVGEAPRGTFSYLMPENLYNVYFLTWENGSTAHFQHHESVTAGSILTDASFNFREHREHDYQFRHMALAPGTTDNFFWLYFQAGQDPKSTFQVHVDFPGFDPSVGKPVELSFRIFGVTNLPALKPGHKFSARYGDYDLGTFSFDGMRYYDFQTSIPASQVKKRQRITFQTPPGREDVVDQIALDSIDVSYPRTLDAGKSEYFRFSNELTGHELPQRVVVKGLEGGTQIYGIEERSLYTVPDSATTLAVSMSDRPTSYVAVSARGHMRVDNLQFNRDSGALLTQVANDVETLVIYHPRLRRAADLYGRYRSSRGMAVKSVDVTRIYDALSSGYISDVAIKDYIRYVAEHSEQLRYVVLFGDATFDYRQARTFDDENQPGTLIPIHWAVNPNTTWTGGYQDDNWYGSIAEPHRPDLAVGRIPANTDKEGIEYIRKLIEYEVLRQGRDDKALLISSVEKNFQELVLEVGEKYADQFTTVTTLFPETSEATREVTRLRDEINSGVQLLYYLGHGGTFVWRVGPTDFKQQKDLFTPADVAKLSNQGHYPIIACSSCYTTSFDHALSLGEALVLKPAGGAIAMFGSPWKATVHESHRFNSLVFEHYFRPGVKRLGQAFLEANREIIPAGASQPAFQSFTLLGDPCLEIPGKTPAYEENQSTSSSMVYSLREGEVFLPGWDDSSSSGSSDLLRLGANIFEKGGGGHLYRERLLLGQGSTSSTLFKVPEGATKLILLGRARADQDIFPRVRVSLETTGGSAPKTVYEGHMQSVSLSETTIPLPPEFSGKEVSVRLEFLNPSFLNDNRTYYLAAVILR